MELDSVQEYILLNKIGMCIKDPWMGAEHEMDYQLLQNAIGATYAGIV